MMNSKFTRFFAWAAIAAVGVLAVLMYGSAVVAASPDSVPLVTIPVADYDRMRSETRILRQSLTRERRISKKLSSVSARNVRARLAAERALFVAQKAVAEAKKAALQRTCLKDR